jgi:hypothetical protein
MPGYGPSASPLWRMSPKTPTTSCQTGSLRNEKLIRRPIGLSPGKCLSAIDSLITRA